MEVKYHRPTHKLLFFCYMEFAHISHHDPIFVRHLPSFIAVSVSSTTVQDIRMVMNRPTPSAVQCRCFLLSFLYSSQLHTCHNFHGYHKSRFFIVDFTLPFWSILFTIGLAGHYWIEDCRGVSILVRAVFVNLYMYFLWSWNECGRISSFPY